MLAALGGCRRESGDVREPPPPPKVSITTVTSAETFPVAQPLDIDVDGDRSLRVAHAPAGERRAIVYLHGMCSTPDEDVADMAEITRVHGTLIAVKADQPCPDGGTKWTADEEAIQGRIDRALETTARARNGELDKMRLTIIGESQGASRAEALARRYADRYPYVVLVGAPTRPRVESFPSAAAVAVVAGEREAQKDSVAGADVLAKAGKKARFFEIPLATHGTFGD